MTYYTLETVCRESDTVTQRKRFRSLEKAGLEYQVLAGRILSSPLDHQKKVEVRLISSTGQTLATTTKAVE